MKEKTQIPVVGVVTAMWKRHELTEIIFCNLAMLRDALRDVIDLRLAVAGSEGAESKALAEKYGFAYAEVPNEPLGAKWNAALRLLQGIDIEGVCIVGSDDLLNAAYFHMVAESLRKGEKLFGIGSFYIMDRFSGRMFHWMGYPPPREKEVIGLGRFIHREYIEALGWTLWEDALPNGLDRSMCQRIEALGAATGKEHHFVFKSIEEYGIAPVDVKHEQQMWPYEITALVCYQIQMKSDARAFLAQYYDTALLDQIFAPCLEHVVAEEDCCIPPWDTASIIYAQQVGATLAGFVALSSKTPVFAPHALRRNITYIPSASRSHKRIEDAMNSFAVLRAQHPTTQLHIHSVLYEGQDLSRYGIYCYGFGNIHTWRNLFRAYIVEDGESNARIVEDLIAHGNIAICFHGMTRILSEQQQNATLMVNNIAEAMKLAHAIHDNAALWQTITNRVRR